jgi:signal transduction histidine kinase
MLAAILLVLIVASAWWSVRLHRQSTHAAQRDAIQSIGALLAEASVTLLEAGELSAVRRLLIDTQYANGLGTCDIVLADGVLAHTDPSQITVEQLPPTWSDASVTVPEPIPSPGAIVLSYPLEIPGRGTLRLDISGQIERVAAIQWNTFTGMALLGAIALAALLLIYRRIRARMQALAAIRESLHAIGCGEESTAALRVSDQLGPDATTWNQLIADRERLEKQVLGRQVGETLANRRCGSGELDSACNVMREGLLLIERDLGVTYANGAAAVYLGATRDALVGASLPDVINDPKVLQAAREVVGGVTRTWVWVEVGELGEAEGSVLRFSIRPIRHDDTGDAVVVISDITQQRVAEASRQAFVENVNHELRNPLTAIRCATESIIDLGETEPDQQRRFLNVINQATRRLERAVNDLLSVAEMEAGQYELKYDDIRLETVLADLELDFDSLASSRQVALSLQLPPKMPVIQGDREKFCLALHNIVGNAIKYTPRGGRVTVAVEIDERAMSIEVTDTGIGIPQEDLEHVFDKFHRADNARDSDTPGSGIGLSLAREIVQLHGGDIEVESELNQGSRFILNMPTTARAA